MSQQILNPGLDPTNFAVLSGSQLDQMFSAATLATAIGANIVTLDDAGGIPTVPNPNADPTLATFIWIRIGYPTASGNFATAYVWNPNSANPTNPTQLLNWNPITAASIPPGSIQGYQIAANTIPPTALQNGITPSQVIGLQSLMLTALTTVSTPAAGAITGSFASGLFLAAGAINNSNLFKPGVLNSYTFFSGQVILPSNIDTTVSAPAAGSVLMAPNGATYTAAWVSKAILNMAEPNNQEGYIPVVQSNGSIALQSPTTAFPAGAIFASAEVQGTGSITISAVSGTLNAWTLSTANTGTLIAGQTYVTIAGMGTKYANLNGTWLVTAVTPNTSFTVTTVGNIAGSGTTTIGTCKYCNYIGSSNLNVANSPTLVSGGTSSVVYNSTGNYTIYFVSPRGSGNYIVLASALDTGSSVLFVKVVAKTSTYVTIQVGFLATGVGITLTPTDNADVSIIVI